MKRNKIISLAIIIGKFNDGGIEKVVSNYYKYFDNNVIKFTIFCHDNSNNIPYEEIDKLGGKVVLIPSYKNVFKYIRVLTKLLKQDKYDIVHAHANALSVLPLMCAKRAGIKVRIASSHSTSHKKEHIRNIIKNILRRFSKIYATDYFACSNHAGKWLFGNDILLNKKYYNMKNAVEIDKYKYDKKIRTEYRKKLNIKSNTIVIGNVGRFVTQKNHEFLIDIFNEIHKEKKNTMLVLVGTGQLTDNIKNKVDELNLTKYVLFLGHRDDVECLYQAFDIFLFPSLYEGLGLVLIEAQISGLLCIGSTEVPMEAKITDNLKFIPLYKSPKYWSDYIIDKYNNYDRKEQSLSGAENGYNIIYAAEELEKKYIELSEKI